MMSSSPPRFHGEPIPAPPCQHEQHNAPHSRNSRSPTPQKNILKPFSPKTFPILNISNSTLYSTTSQVIDAKPVPKKLLSPNTSNSTLYSTTPQSVKRINLPQKAPQSQCRRFRPRIHETYSYQPCKAWNLLSLPTQALQLPAPQIRKASMYKNFPQIFLFLR